MDSPPSNSTLSENKRSYVADRLKDPRISNPRHRVKKQKNPIPKNPTQYRKWRQQQIATKKQRKEEKLIRQMKRHKQHEESLKQGQKLVDEEEVMKKEKGRQYTVSIAVPGSILDNAQSPELRTYLAGQIGRAAVVFNVDEIIVFNEDNSKENTTEGEFTGTGKKGNASVLLARILQYLECPQYLRKSFFPAHSDLRYAGLLNPLDSPHHMKIHDVVQYREGVVLEKQISKRGGSYVNVGLYKPLQIDRQIKPGVRVTVKVDYSYTGKKKYIGKVVSPSEPRTHRGLYWGYTVRIANSLSAVLTESPFKEPYDLTIGTSERGTSVDKFTAPDEYKHLLVVFGGLRGLEACVEDDEKLNIDDPAMLFQHYLNTCPGQGSGTIRTEEAILISLSALRSKLHKTQSETNSVDSGQTNVDSEQGDVDPKEAASNNIDDPELNDVDSDQSAEEMESSDQESETS